MRTVIWATAFAIKLFAFIVATVVLFGPVIGGALGIVRLSGAICGKNGSLVVDKFRMAERTW